MYYRIDINCTGKTGKEDWSTFDNISKVFDSIEKVKNWLKEQYKNCKKIPIYRDRTKNEPVKVGHIFCFKNADWSHSPVQKWYQRDWVEVREVNEKTVLV